MHFVSSSLGLVVSSAVLIAAPVAAQDETPAIPPSLREVFSAHLLQLDSDSWEDRREAFEWLRRAEVPDGVFQILLQASYLSPEQRHEVLALIRDRKLTAKRGALGIEMDLNARSGFGVLVRSVLPNMPAEGKLKRGDRITHVNDEFIASASSFGNFVSSFEPGETITLRILRVEDADDEDGRHADNGNGNAGDAEDMNGNAGERRGRRNAAEATGPLTEHIVQVTLVDDHRLGAVAVAQREERQYREAMALVNTLAPAPRMLHAPEFSSHVEEHPAIRRLRAQLDEYEYLERRMQDLIRSEWRQTKQRLLENYLEPSISIEERQRRLEVYDAYVNLLPRGMRID